MKGPSEKYTNRVTQDNFNALDTKVLIEYLISGSLENRVCRYCLRENNQLVEVCETLNIQVLRVKKEVTIKDIICIVYPRKISQLNDLPEKICNECIAKAISSYLFIQQCHMSETSLTSCIDKLFQNVATLNANYTRHTKDGIVFNIDHEKVIDYALFESNTNENDDLDTIFECSKCKLDFNSIETFVHHQKTHKVTDQHICRTCSKKFVMYKIYLTHIHKVHKILKKYCKNTKPIKSVMNCHFECNCCREIFSSWYNLIEHRDKHKLKKIMDCMIKGTLTKNICRICLKESKELVSILQIVYFYGANWTTGETHVLNDIISQILPLKVSQPYDMPTQICETCIQSAINSYVLKKQYSCSQSLLTACIDNILLYNNKTAIGVNDDIREMCFSAHLDNYYKNMQKRSQFDDDKIKIGAKEKEFNTLVDHKTKDNACVVALKVKNYSKAEKLIPNKTAMKVQILDSNIVLQDPLVLEKEKIEPQKKINGSSDRERCFMMTHPCTMCTKNFPTLLELLEHLKCHAKDMSHLCRDCGNIFAQISALHLHASETHGQESYLYSLKQQSEWQPLNEIAETKKDPSNNSLSHISSKNHNNIKQIKLNIERDNEIFECTMCARDFICQSHLDQHYDTHPPGSLLICRVCNQKFVQLQFLMKHKLTHEPQKKQSANAIYSTGYYSCSKIINNGELPNEHILLHKRKQCRYCKRNISMASYASHLPTHAHLLLKQEKKDNKRKKLGKEERKKKKVNETERIKERESTPPESSHGYQCDKCPQITSSRRTLMVHMNRVHLHVKPYACHICDKAFYGPYHLKEHILIHSNTKPEICEICGNRFVNKMSLMYHKRLHTNERPHKCNECSESFICATRLRNHVRKIHKPWDFICRFCGRKFYDQVLMNKHINGVHLNIKRKRKGTTDV